MSEYTPNNTRWRIGVESAGSRVGWYCQTVYNRYREVLVYVCSLRISCIHLFDYEFLDPRRDSLGYTILRISARRAVTSPACIYV